MKIILQRLRNLAEGKNTSEFARFIGMKQQTVDNYLKGNRTPNAEAIISICSNCGVTADWLLGLVEKKNETFQAKREPVDKDEIIEKLVSTVQSQQQLIAKMQRQNG